MLIPNIFGHGSIEVGPSSHSTVFFSISPRQAILAVATSVKRFMVFSIFMLDVQSSTGYKLCGNKMPCACVAPQVQLDSPVLLHHANYITANSNYNCMHTNWCKPE